MSFAKFINTCESFKKFVQTSTKLVPKEILS